MSQPQQRHERPGEGSGIDIVCHNNPDPDCPASALALGRIAAAAGIDEQQTLHSGDISHRQSRAFVDLLDVDLQSFDAATVQNRQPDSSLAFVDHREELGAAATIRTEYVRTLDISLDGDLAIALLFAIRSAPSTSSAGRPPRSTMRRGIFTSPRIER